MVPDPYVYLFWSCVFLATWAALFALLPGHRAAMLAASLFTAPFGLLEPMFVPEYWSPPSLFDLNQRTGFDLESVIFSFAVGGVAAVLYNALTRRRTRPLGEAERRRLARPFPYLMLAFPFALFFALAPLPWNPIYAGITAMAVGAVVNVLYRPDLLAKTAASGVLFLGYYGLFLAGLMAVAPGYVERVWNLDALSGVLILGMPLEELLFGLTFGMFWSGLYERATWTRPD